MIWIAANQSNAQETDVESDSLTLRQAVEKALSRNPTIAIQQKSIARAEGEKTSAGLLPNPVISYYREDLELNSVDAGEWIVSGSVPLNFLWSRWSQVSAASAQIDAESSFLDDTRRQLKFEVQQAYVETHFAEKNYQALQQAVAIFRKAAEASRERFADGDMSGYERQRIEVEYFRFKKNLTEAQVRYDNRRRQLAFLLDPENPEAQIQTATDLPTSAPQISQEELLSLAWRNRPDLQGTDAMLRSKQSVLTANKWQRLPQINATFGYKEQVDDFNGLVAQIHFGLPLFDRNQGEIKAARAEFEKQTLAADLLRKQVALEVKQAYENFQLYHKMVQDLLNQDSEPLGRLFEIALFSYNEGEMSLVELMDGVSAYTEAIQTQTDVLLKYQLSIFELEKATATTITAF